MKTIFLALIFLTQYCSAQSNPCHCPNNTMAGITIKDAPKLIFNFSNGQEILLCGYKEDDAGKTTYSEFILQECGKDSVVAFWDALFTGTVRFENDIIYIDEIINLPVAQNRDFVQTIWSTETLQYQNGKLLRKYTVNHKLRKYTKQEIGQTLKEFENGSENYNGDIEQLMNRLFIAALSGSKKAMTYFYSFDKFTLLDGATSEEYKDLKAMLELWRE